MEIKKQLDDEIELEFEGLKCIELGSNEYKATVEGLTKLVDKSMELDKMVIDYSFKKKQSRSESIDKWVKNGLTALGIAATTALTLWGTVKTFEFETNGSITSMMGRGFINKLLPKK